MKQVTQRPRDGKIVVSEVPVPAVPPGWVLVRNRCSLISAGTERSKVTLGEKSLIQKARARPDLARKVIDQARVEGLRSTAELVRSRLDALAPMGYSSAGEVLEVGDGVEGLQPGDAVACAGAGWANHAEVVAVPRNLTAVVPASVTPEQAAYGTVGAIALHGVRRGDPALGEHVGVIGLGLVGQLAVRLLRAAGCQVFGIDLDPSAVDLAEMDGVVALRRDDPALEQRIRDATGGRGLDVTLLCAATASTDPIELAARLARDRGRLVVVGDLPVEVERALAYEKELEIRLSRSYGPGRYDREYEERGRDLPAGYVRWTEQRNLQAFVDAIAGGRLDPSPLTTHRFAVDDAAEAYAALSGEADGPRPFGILLEYSGETESVDEAAPAPRVPTRARTAPLRVGLVGTGAFAQKTLLPALKRHGAQLAVVASQGGLTAADVASRFGAARTESDAQRLVDADDVDAVVIATRHGSHAALAAAALRAGKAVFVEKPLALTAEQLQQVEEAIAGDSVLMVGFNRRFAPLTERLNGALGQGEARVLTARVNAGPLPRDHWLHDPEEGGGRLLGEGCHFVDLLGHLAGESPHSAHAVAVPDAERGIASSDDVVATLRYPGGTVATLIYTGSGDSRLPKERIEAFGGGAAAVLDDFRRLEIYRGGKRSTTKSSQDKGHDAQIGCFVAAATGQAAAPPVASYLASTRATLALAESLRVGAPVKLA